MADIPAERDEGKNCLRRGGFACPDIAGPPKQIMPKIKNVDIAIA